ncbi:MAG TPA: cyclic dehypoxanthinyl futalosine synthase, partial [Polyangia bacterium]
MNARTRLAAVPFLSARPLTYGIERGLVEDLFELTFDSAEGCARRVSNGLADLALVPSASYPRLSSKPGLDLRVVPRLAVVVFDEVPPELGDQHSLGLLSGSVGDWRRRTGLPFVSFLWVGRNGAASAEVANLLDQSLGLGLVHLRDIADAFGESQGGDPSLYESYLARSLSYRLGSQELSGLAAFVEHLRMAEATAPTSTRIRLFDFAYAPEVRKPITELGGSKKARTPGLDGLLSDAAHGNRLSLAAALRLYENASLLDLGRAADERRRFLHPQNLVTYIIDRNVNYTNLCVTACKFCNFYRPAKSKEAYILSREVLAQKFSETVAMGGIQILLQGGVNPQLRLDYYEDLFRWTKASFPLALHALSPEEVSFIARQERLSIGEVLERLVAAGLDSLPGGGAEILDDEIRKRISPLKCSADTWIDVMREAHALGLRTTATLVFGFGETPAHIVKHFERLRALQDQTAGFTAFICWPFQGEGTRLRLGDDTTAQRYLRVFSLARLYLDNFPNLQVSWPTMGPAIGQVALRFGGNDFGSAMIEENVVSQAGAVFRLSAGDIEQRVRAAGFVPHQRNMRYELLPMRRGAVPLGHEAVGAPEVASFLLGAKRLCGNEDNFPT